jgi:very-short-patch-repair endonuclease
MTREIEDVGTCWDSAGVTNLTKVNSSLLTRTLNSQHGVLTRRQALAAGLTMDMVQRRIRRGGPWQRLLPGVYLTVTGTPVIDQRDIAAMLYAGPGSIITAAAALRRHGMRTADADVIDVLIPITRRRESAGFVKIHRTARLPEAAYASGSVTFATPARAVADFARGLTALPAVRAVAASAVQRGRCTVAQLADELARGPVQGSALLRLALAEIADGVRSGAEGDFRALLIRAGLPLPMFNAQLYCGDVLLAIADAWWPDAGLAAEVDSREWHLSPADWEHTMRRHARMGACGIVVLHFTPHQIRFEQAMVVETIKAALDSGHGSPAMIQARPAR